MLLSFFMHCYVMLDQILRGAYGKVVTVKALHTLLSLMRGKHAMTLFRRIGRKLLGEVVTLVPSVLLKLKLASSTEENQKLAQECTELVAPLTAALSLAVEMEVEEEVDNVSVVCSDSEEAEEDEEWLSADEAESATPTATPATIVGDTDVVNLSVKQVVEMLKAPAKLTAKLTIDLVRALNQYLDTQAADNQVVPNLFAHTPVLVIVCSAVSHLYVTKGKASINRTEATGLTAVLGTLFHSLLTWFGPSAVPNDDMIVSAMACSLSSSIDLDVRVDLIAAVASVMRIRDVNYHVTWCNAIVPSFCELLAEYYDEHKHIKRDDSDLVKNTTPYSKEALDVLSALAEMSKAASAEWLEVARADHSFNNLFTHLKTSRNIEIKKAATVIARTCGF